MLYNVIQNEMLCKMQFNGKFYQWLYTEIKKYYMLFVYEVCLHEKFYIRFVIHFYILCNHSGVLIAVVNLMPLQTT